MKRQRNSPLNVFIPTKRRSLWQVTRTELEAAKALRNAPRAPTVTVPVVRESRMNNLQAGPVMDVFRIIDSVHDIYDRAVQQKIKAMVPAPVLSRAEQDELKGIQKNLGAMKGKRGTKNIKVVLEKRKKELERARDRFRSSSYPENDFVEDLFDFKRNYGGVYRSINDKPFRASTFKSWIQQYLDLGTTTTSLTLSEMKNEWKNKFLQLAQRRNMTLFDQEITCRALPNMNLTNSKMTRTLTGNIIREYKLLLATDALKTSDTLSNATLNRVTVKTGLEGILNDRSLEDNYIVNMAQVVDPATNIRVDKNYRFAFVPMKRLNNVKQYIGVDSTSFSTFYELMDMNEQFTCHFKIIVELIENSNPVFQELKRFIASNVNTDFLSQAKTTPQEFFENVRVYVFPFNKTSTQPLSVNGLCIQTRRFVKVYPRYAWQDRNDKRSAFKVHNDLTGFSVDEVIKFMQADTPNSKDPKWIIRHYLDWKRMGDSFQITHMLKLSQLNNALFAKKNNLQGFHPYHFVSIDILAIVQAIMFNVNFVYQMNGNAFIIGNNQQGTPMAKYIIQVLGACQQRIREREELEAQRKKNERGANIMLGAANRSRGNYNNNNNNNNNNNYELSFNNTLNSQFRYNNLNQKDLLRLLNECRAQYLRLKYKR